MQTCRYKVRSGVLTSISSKQLSAVSVRPLPERTDWECLELDPQSATSYPKVYDISSRSLRPSPSNPIHARYGACRLVVQCLPPDEGLAARRIPLQQLMSILSRSCCLSNRQSNPFNDIVRPTSALSTTTSVSWCTSLD